MKYHCLWENQIHFCKFNPISQKIKASPLHVDKPNNNPIRKNVSDYRDPNCGTINSSTRVLSRDKGDFINLLHSSLSFSRSRNFREKQRCGRYKSAAAEVEVDV